jgi:glycosyltransferase involved in cell wall biosynthesis
MRILHIITGLGRGGAEATLFRIISADATNSHAVVSLTDAGEYGDRLERIGVDVQTLGMSASLRAVWHGVDALRSRIANDAPDVVQTWLYQADLIGGLAAWLAGHRAIVWNIRSSPPSFRFAKLSSFFTIIVLALFSWWLPSKIVACGDEPRKSHIRRGFRSSKMIPIPNGLGDSQWQADEKRRSLVRERLDIDKTVLIFAQIANYHAVKRHSLLLKAFKELSNEVESVHLVLAGENITDSNRDLTSLIEKLSLNSRVTLVGKQPDVRAVLDALDVLVSPSASEGFPNVVLEALFMGKPCIVSNAGESEIVVGPGGWVFRPDNVEGLLKALTDAARVGADSLRVIGQKGREHVIESYSEQKMVASYQTVWSQVYGQNFKRFQT